MMTSAVKIFPTVLLQPSPDFMPTGPTTTITFNPSETQDPDYWAEMMKHVLKKWDYSYIVYPDGVIEWEEEQEVPLPQYIEWHEEVWDKHLEGKSQRQIAQELDLHRVTVRRALEYHRGVIRS